MDSQAEFACACGCLVNRRHIVSVVPFGELLLKIQIRDDDRRLRMEQDGQAEGK